MAYNETGLQPNTLYTRNVAVSNSLGLNSTPNLSVATKIEDIANVSLVQITSNSISLQVNDNLSNLGTGNSGVLYSISGPGGGNSGWIKASTYTFTGLIPEKNYTISLQVRNQQSYPSNGVTFTTRTLVTPVPLLPNLPDALPFLNVGQNSLTANWGVNNNPSGTQYQVDLSSTTSPFAQSSWQTQTTYNFTGLLPNVTYYIRARARNSA